MKRLCLIATAALLMMTSPAIAAVIGNWEGSSFGRAWDGSTEVTALMTGRGHVVETAGALTAGELANDDVFVIAEATRALTAQEALDLAAWVFAGGRLLVTADSGGVGVAHGNAILSAIGSGLSFGGSAFNGYLQPDAILTTGGPFNIVGQVLEVTPGTGVNGGTMIAGSFVGAEQFGAGYVVGFGDHLQNDVFNPSAANVNGQFLINLVESAPAPAPAPIPLPATFPALLLGLGVLAGVSTFAAGRDARR